MFQRTIARARRFCKPLSSRSAAATKAGSVLPEALERRVLMTSTVSISAGGSAVETGTGTITFAVTRTFPWPAGTDYAYLSLGGVAKESGPGDDFDFSGGGAPTWDAVAGMYKVALGTPGSSFMVDPLSDANYEEGNEALVITLHSVTGDNVINGSASSATGQIIDSTTLQLTETVPLSPRHGDPNAAGDDPGALGVSAGGVRYFDGSPVLETQDLAGFAGWGHTRSFEDALGSVGSTGNAWAAAERPFLAQKSTSLVVVDSAAGQRWFDSSGGGYTGRYFVKDTLTAGTGEFILTGTDGSITKFYDFSTGLPVHQRGTFKSFTDPAGNVTTVHSVSGTGRATEVRRSGGGVVEALVYAYTATGSATTAELLESVTLKRSTDGGSTFPTVVRKVEYSYYDGTLTGAHAFGDGRDLRTATIKDGSGATVETKYYRYWTDNTAAGRYGAIKYVVEGDDYERLDAAVADPLLATDGEVALYATHYYEYDSGRKVTKHVEQGAGGDTGGAGGRGTTTFAYATNANNPSGGATDWNWWKNKTTETLPDGSQRIVYLNKFGEVMLDVFQAVGGSQWRTFHKYDSAGRIVLTAHPSAVTGFSESNGDLLAANVMTGNYSYLSDSTGLVETTTYGSSTTATSGSAGDVTGYLKSRAIKQGETGTSVPQFAQTYFERTAGGATVYPVASETVYRNDNGTGGQTTSYAYTFHTGTTGVESVTTTLPTVTTAQNGPNAAATETTFLDVYGHPTWTKDADGFINAFEYDAASGAVTKMIEDVNTAASSNEPSGWTTPAGGGLHLTTTMLVDARGRTTKLTDPNGNITYTVYRDYEHEVRVYPGWTGTTTTGPTQVFREDRQRKYVEELTMSATPAVYSGAPLGTESIANVESLRRTHLNDAGQLTASDRYVSLSGQTYSATTLTIGTAGTHYHRAELGYDERGRMHRAKNANGTITRTIYDGLDRLTSTWVGTDDTGATSGDPDGSGSPNNMRKVLDNEYDNAGVGDGNLTKTTGYPGGSGTNQVSRMYYDWRNRPVAAKSGDQGGSGENTDVNRQLVYVWEAPQTSYPPAAAGRRGGGVGQDTGSMVGGPDPPHQQERTHELGFELR